MIAETLDICTKLGLSALFSGIIGLEREIHGRAAGLRTHILVAVGSCLIMLTSTHIYDAYHGIAQCDPARIAAGVVTGIGFLGAGTILRYRISVIGLTTAASIWVVAAIGLAIGSDYYAGASATTLLVISTLIIMSKIERAMIRKDWYKTLILVAELDVHQLQKVRAVLTDYKGEIRDFEIEKIPGRTESRISFDIKLTTNKYDDNIVVELLKLEGVNKAYWE